MTFLNRLRPLRPLQSLRHITRAALLAAALATGLGGCASNSAAPVLLTLPAAATTAPTAPPVPSTSSAPHPQLTLRRITLPEYLVARRVRYRADAATLAEWPNTYWAERIEIGVAREFVAALRQQLPGWTVCAAGCGESAAPLTLEIDMLALDYLRATQTLQARARLMLRGAAPGNELTDELAYELPTGADTAAAQAQAIATVLRKLAAAAAVRIRAVPPAN